MHPGGQDDVGERKTFFVPVLCGSSFIYVFSLLQGIFPTQGSNPGLPHCRQILYHVRHQEAHHLFNIMLLYLAVLNNSESCRIWTEELLEEIDERKEMVSALNEPSLLQLLLCIAMLLFYKTYKWWQAEFEVTDGTTDSSPDCSS